jgi:hypothetical protein
MVRLDLRSSRFVTKEGLGRLPPPPYPRPAPIKLWDASGGQTFTVSGVTFP